MEIRRLSQTHYEQWCQRFSYILFEGFGTDQNLTMEQFVTKVMAKVKEVDFGSDPLESVRLIYAMHWYALHGKKNFRVSDDLAVMLLATDYTSVYMDFLKLPFPSISIDVSNIGIPDVEGLYVDRHSDPKKVHTTQLRFLVLTKGNGVERFNLEDKSGTDIMKELKGSDLAKDYEDNFIKIVKYAISVILYINSTDVEMLEVKPKVLFAKKDSKYPVCLLGSSIQIDKKRYEINDNGDHGESVSERIYHILKWSVRGHFRQQPCGVGRKDRELKWIQPYFKGAERETSIDAKPGNYEVVPFASVWPWKK